MSGPAGAAVSFRLEGFEHNRFIALHVGEIIPDMVGVESHVSGAGLPGWGSRVGGRVFTFDIQ